MPLRLNLRPYEQIMVNGAVITNLHRRAFLAVHNRAHLLPGKHILKAERAETPVRRTYFAAQMAYIHAEQPEECAPWIEEFNSRWQEVAEALARPDIHEKLEAARQSFDERQYYRTLRLLQDVIDYENNLLAMAGDPPPPAFGDGLNPPDKWEEGQ